MTEQLELFARDPMEHLFPYWRDRLQEWVRDIWRYRHQRDTTGWSMARQGYIFAQCLFMHEQMARPELRRWWRLDKRVRRYHANETECTKRGG